MKHTALTHQRTLGFSLVEVMLALGIVTFGLISIFGLFVVTAKSSNDIVEQQEATSVARAFTSYLQSQDNTSTSNNFSIVYGYLTGTKPLLMSYNLPASNATTSSGVAIGLATNSTFTTDAASRSGRLFYIDFVASPNMTFHSKGAVVATPKDQTIILPAALTDYDEASLPIQARIYATSVIPTATNLPAITSHKPVMIYETTLSR